MSGEPISSSRIKYLKKKEPVYERLAKPVASKRARPTTAYTSKTAMATSFTKPKRKKDTGQAPSVT